MDIKQFAMTGINIYQLLANATGKSIDEVKEMDVSYELLAASLEKAAGAGGLYAGAMEAQSKTVGGRWSTLMDEIAIGAADIGTALQPLMHALLDVGMAIATTVVPAVVSMVNWMKENWSWLSILAGVIGAAVAGYYAYMAVVQGVGMVTKAWTAIQWGLNAAIKANPVGLIIAGLAALVVGIVLAWKKFEGFRMAVLGLWEVFKQVFTNIGSFFKKIFEPISQAIAAFKEGRYMDAAKAVGKMVFNLTPVGLAGNAIDFAREGGFNKGLSQAWQRGRGPTAPPGDFAREDGFNKGLSQAWQRGRDLGKNKETPVGASDPSPALQSMPVPTAATTPGENDVVRGIAGGGPRVINIYITKLVEKIELHAATFKEGLNEVESEVEKTFLRVLNSGASIQ
jgi:hypothetical protein